MKKALLSTLLVTALALPMTAMADVPSPHLSVTGQGEVSVAPNMATFTVSVTSKQRTALSAKEHVDTAVSNLLSSLLSDGLAKSDIQSANLSIYPQYHYPKEGQRTLTGYQGSRDVTVTVNKLDKLNDYLNIALKDGMNQVQSVQFSVKDKAKYKALAREKAIQNAKEKAASLAKGFDVQLNGIWDVHYGVNNDFPMPRMSVNFAAMDSMKMTNESYQQKEIKVSDSVSVTYMIKNR